MDYLVERYSTGATRSADNPFDPEGFLNPNVLRHFSKYMERHRYQKDGSLRGSDNWQRGIPSDRAMRSLTRHFLDLWLIGRGYGPESKDCEGKTDALCAILFNAMLLIKNHVEGEPKI